MKHLFVPYELAVKLKEKRFDEYCLAYFEVNKNFRGIWSEEMNPVDNSALFDGEISAPLYQQVIDWFDEKHQIIISVKPTSLNDGEWILYDSEAKIIKTGIEMYRQDYDHKRILKGAWTVAIEEALKLIP